MTDIGTAVQRASAYLTDNPGEARYRDSHARARLGEGLRVEVEGPGGERLTTDMPKGIGGDPTKPSPGWTRSSPPSRIRRLRSSKARTAGT